MLKGALISLAALSAVTQLEPALALSGYYKGAQVIAHRGGTTWAPENTLDGFKRSLEAGANAIELDIHKCKSGELVVIHDETLERTTDGHGYIKDKTLDELKLLNAGKGEKLPLLSEVLKLVDGKAEINIEIKNTPIAYPNIEDDLIALLSTYKHPERINIISFDHQVLARLHKKAPQYKIGILGTSLIADIGSYAKVTGAKIWLPSVDTVREDAVKDAHANGLKVYVWTVDEEKDWPLLTGMGVDGIITNNPAGLLAYQKQFQRAPQKSIK